MTCIDIVFRGKPVNPKSKMWAVLIMTPFVILGTVFAGMGISMLRVENQFLQGALIFTLVLFGIVFIGVFVRYALCYCHGGDIEREDKEYNKELSAWNVARHAVIAEAKHIKHTPDDLMCRINALEAALRVATAPSAPSAPPSKYVSVPIVSR